MMKGMFSTFILSFVLMMVWSVRADTTNRPSYINQYCSVNYLDCFGKCFNNTVSAENLNIFYNCLRDQTSTTGSEGIKQFLCETVTNEQLKEFHKCIHYDNLQSVFSRQFECCIQSCFPLLVVYPFVVYICRFIS
ncbi:uncharacterized protein LOC111642566 [Centruroides sculpturatus]|uniref:uncharacterized protein LOC111642566 n=1 Tax=Centruroides sculpturatus TaxID=218467 RepID=UPI000C6EEA3E|nr:uncharacterized protein LOC111642566 [Centruroides sculpturatus]